jgi:DNA-binding FrmR family transcriptional regulator
MNEPTASPPTARPAGATTVAEAPPAWPGYTPEKDALRKRLRRIEGQVRGLERMVESDRYCIDVLTQIAAVSTALEAVALRILDAHVTHCVAGALASGDPEAAAEKSRELIDAVHRFTHSH